MNESTMRLYTFQISHFSEKARFALDFSGIPYEEKRLLPGPHLLTTRRLGGRSVPVLANGKTTVHGSGAILDHLETDLGFAALAVSPENKTRATEIEALADVAFGRGIQCLFYNVLFDNPRLLVDMWTQRGPFWGRAFYAVTMPFVRSKTREMYRIDPDGVAKAKDAFHRAFDETDRMLGDREYLFGDALTRSDIAVSALLAPLCRPPEHPFEWPTERPPELVEFTQSFEGRPTWNYVLRVYSEHRRRAPR